MKVVIVGASYAGLSAALEIRQQQPASQIQVIEQQTEVGYLANGVPLVLSGKVASLAAAKWLNKSTLAAQNIELYTGETVIGIETQQKKIQTDQRELKYDALILASGARIPETAREEESGKPYYTIGNYQQDQHVLTAIQAAHVITVVGAGQAGIELADALIQAGKKVQLIEQYHYPLFKYFDQEFLAAFIATLKEQPRLTLYLNQHARIQEAEALAVQVGEQKLATEVLLYSGSLQPNHPYLGSLVDLHSDQTVRVNSHFETSVPNIYAIGNLIQQRFPLTNDSYYMPSKENARRTGQAVAQILTGVSTTYPGSLRTLAMQAFGYALASTGLLHSEAFLYEGQVVTQQAEYRISAAQAVKLTAQYVYDQTSKKVLGVQLIGDTVSLVPAIQIFEEAIFNGVTIETVQSGDFQKRWLPTVKTDRPTSASRKGRADNEV